MQLMMSHHDVIMKQYNKAVAERLAKIVEERTKGRFKKVDRLINKSGIFVPKFKQENLSNALLSAFFYFPSSLLFPVQFFTL